MKEVLAKELEVGDIFYFDDRYWEVISILLTIVRAKCIMSPTNLYKNIGDYYYLYETSKVLLLVRDGEQV